MIGSTEEERQRPPRRVPAPVRRTVEAARIDLASMHGTWMGLAFPRKYVGEHAVVENWTPRTTTGVVAYRAWAALGVLLLVALYPLNILGLATRFYARRLDRTSASLGVAGVVGVSLLAWGALTAATYVSPIAFEGFVAVAIAGAVATGSAVLALYFTRRGGRASTVALGYPLGMTALFLPPVVAALYSPTLAAFVFPRSESVAIWILDNLLAYGGLATFIRTSYELEGLAYVGMWFGIAVPMGWALGILVTYVNVVRPAEADALYGGGAR
jgi:hypothetical protein